jgi:hypothetical protein
MDVYRPRRSHPLLRKRSPRKVPAPTSGGADARPPWDDSVHNLDVYALTVEEQVR